ncbi:MAG: glycosyltransferase, partial [Candidatus Omnitrophica bacterium]|nr:glycosyltransferase [Candidatus Omnitrophota bacterium]
MSEPLVSAIIVTAGARGHIYSCLDAVRQQSLLPLEIIVIDNSQNQDLKSELNRSYPLAKVYSSEENKFYCNALDIGIKMSKGDFILCLNDDVILDKDFLARALKGFTIDNQNGMLSGKILRRNKKIIDSTGLFLSPWRTAKERGYSQFDRGQFDTEGYVFGVSGAAALYRREMLEDIKVAEEYFDSDFRFYYEDLDIAWRAQNRGWKGYYMPSAIAYHVR